MTRRAFLIAFITLFAGTASIDTESAEYIPITIAPDPLTNNWPRKESSGTYCPTGVSIAFTLDDKNENLDLSLNTHISPKSIAAYVGTTNGISVITGILEHPACFYQDPTTEAAFSFERPTGGSLSMYGSFMTVSATYALESPGSSNRPDNSTVLPDEQRPSNQHYLIYKLNDYGLTAKSGQRNKKRNAVTQNHVEAFAVIDYSIYERWYNWANDGVSALEHIKYYFAHIFNDIDNIYRAIDSSEITIDVTWVGYYIATTESMADFVESKVQDGKVNGQAIRRSFKKWLRENKGTFEDYDHAMLFTGYDIYSVDKDTGEKNYEIIGQAPVLGICTRDGLSVNEDTGRYKSAVTAAHELGHNLGAAHDGVNNSCQASDHYVMTSIFSAHSSNYISNGYQFSTCSVDYFEKEISSFAEGENCMLNTPSVYNSDEYDSNLSELPGNKFTFNDQCAQVHGTGSEYCGGTTDISNVCTAMRCTDPESNECSLINNAGDGSHCGHKMWCWNGQCVANDNAPDLQDCQYGNYGDTITLNGATTVTCQEWVTSGVPCYSEDAADLCCESCNSYYDAGNVGCEYGDKVETVNVNNVVRSCTDWISAETYNCYNANNRNICCGTCATFYNPSNTNCEYGDKADFCANMTPNSCYYNDGPCCEACKAFETDDPNCKYGVDQASWCPNYMSSANCYNYNDVCCDTCKAFETGDPACPYGDRDDNCPGIDVFYCMYSNIAEICCGTCA